MTVPRILLALAFLALLGYSVAGLFDSTYDRPNILVLMVDDLGYNDLAINNGNSGIETPVMDQIAREGVRFTRHYGHSSCTPARVAFLTGMYPERLGFLPSARGISTEIVTMPERLRELGYNTWHIGKWHIGEFERTAWPDHQGFDHWFGFLTQEWLAGAHDGEELKLKKPRYNDPWLQGDDEPGRFYPGHLENILTNKAIEALSELAEERSPWLLNVWFFAPHAPVQPAPEFAARYPDTPAGQYRALVKQLDTNIGRIIAHLDELGVMDNTIIVIVSDNGGTNGALDNNAPFHGRKVQNREGGLRTPLVIRWPDPAVNGQVIAEAISIEDIYPTLLDAIGEPVPDNLDGVSYYPRVTGQGEAPRKTQFRETNLGSYSVLSADGRWRLYQPFIFRDVLPELVLYDLEEDPAAEHGVEHPPPAQIRALQAEYLDWYKAIHTVPTHFTRDSHGRGVLTGMDFIRTPGFGGYTIGFGIAGDYHGFIASQGETWQIERNGEKISARFGDQVLSGSFPESDACRSVVISGDFHRKLTSWARQPDRFSLALWIDGVEVDSVEVAGVLQVADPTIDTSIGHPVTEGDSERLSPPVILNTRLDSSTPWSLQSFSQSLCEETD